MVKDIDFAALKGLADKATPGEWKPTYEAPGSHGGGDTWHVIADHSCLTCDSNEHDARFIAASRQAIPALIERVAELERLLHEAREALDIGGTRRDDPAAATAKETCDA